MNQRSAHLGIPIVDPVAFLHRSCIDLFDVAVSHSLPDSLNARNSSPPCPESHMLV